MTLQAASRLSAIIMIERAPSCVVSHGPVFSCLKHGLSPPGRVRLQENRFSFPWTDSIVRFCRSWSLPVRRRILQLLHRAVPQGPCPLAQRRSVSDLVNRCWEVEKVEGYRGNPAKSQAANKEGARGSSGQDGGARGGPREARGTLRRQTRATSIGRGAIPAMRTGTPDRARPTQAPPPDRGGSGARQDPPRPLHHLRYPGKQVQPRLQRSTYGQRTVNAGRNMLNSAVF